MKIGQLCQSYERMYSGTVFFKFTVYNGMSNTVRVLHSLRLGQCGFSIGIKISDNHFFLGCLFTTAVQVCISNEIPDSYLTWEYRKNGNGHGLVWERVQEWKIGIASG